MKYIFTLLYFLIPSLAFSAQSDWEGVKTLKCTFNNGASLEGKNVKITDKPFGEDSMVYDSIDVKNKTARMIGNAGADDSMVLEAGDMLTLVNRTLTGNLVFTSFSKKSNTDFDVVMSRHMLMLGKPIYSQNYGICKLLN